MDFLQRAATFLDRALERPAYMMNGNYRPAPSATELRSLEARQAYLRGQLEHAFMELGKLTYQRWKNHGIGNDDALAVLCRQIDAMNAEYQQVLGALADARPGQNGGRSGPFVPQPAQAYGPARGFPAAQPAPVPAPTAPPAWYGHGRPYPVQGAAPQPANGAPPLPPGPMPGPFPPAGQAQLGQVVPALPAAPPKPPRPPKPARECPECYTMVPGDVDFCPSCGMRV